jgi:hypothetical protein
MSPTRTRRCSTSPTAFTLTELLLVLSLISLLLSIVTPSFSRSRRAAARAKCLSNLHQIGNGMGAYFADSRDAFPWFATYEYVHNHRTNQAWFYGGRYPPIGVELVHVTPEMRFLPEERPLNAHVYPRVTGVKADLKVYRCPSEDGVRWVGEETVEPEADRRTAYLTTGTSYPSNWWWLKFSHLLANRERDELGCMPDYGNQMTRYKLSVRGAGVFAVVYGDPLDTMVHVHIRHAGWHDQPGFSEILFLDGHADYLLTDTTDSNWQTGNPEWTLWFNEPSSDIPQRFLPPFPGIEEWQGP